MPSPAYEPYNTDKYLGALTRLLQSDHFATHEDARLLLDVRETVDGRILAWDCERKRVRFRRDDVFLAITERARVRGSQFWVEEHHYHYQPGGASHRREFRICLDDDGPHFNSDGANRLPHAMKQGVDHDLDIRSFNTLFFLVVAMQYTACGKYPVERGNEAAYNRSIGRKRREIK